MEAAASKRKISETEIFDSDSDDSDVIEVKSKSEETNIATDDLKPECPYGSKCYRTNASHHIQFSHAPNSNEQSSKRVKLNEEKPPSSSFHNFYLTKVNNVAQSEKINSHFSLGIKGFFFKNY
jgi:hypothetical protein